MLATTRLWAAAASVVLACMLAACNSLTQAIEVDLPPFESQLVVECYVEADSLFRVSVSETLPAFSTPSTTPLVSTAAVTISYGSTTLPLTYYPPGSPGNQFAFGEYRSATRCPIDYSLTFDLRVTDAAGRVVTGTTRLQLPVPIDTIKYTFERDKAGLQVEFFDPNTAAINYYRTLYDDGRPDSLTSFVRNDQIRQGAARDFTFAPFNYERGDSIMVRLYHIDKSYYDFLQSVGRARAGQQNLFREPGVVYSNVRGGVGVFAGATQTRKFVIIR